MKIELVTEEDAQELLEIYAPYILETAITFEYEIPTLEDFKERIKNTLEAYPYLKAVDENQKILGYAYAGRLKGRKAYDYAVELSVYVRQDCRRGGVGRALYAKMEEMLKSMHILNLCACITVPVAEEDEYATFDSVHFHEKMGYKLLGTFHKCGYKFHRWYNMCWMEKIIGEHETDMPEVPFGKYKL